MLLRITTSLEDAEEAKAGSIRKPPAASRKPSAKATAESQ